MGTGWPIRMPVVRERRWIGADAEAGDCGVDRYARRSLLEWQKSKKLDATHPIVGPLPEIAHR